MDIRGAADIHYPQAALTPQHSLLSRRCRTQHRPQPALLGRDVHLISAIGSDFYGETLVEQTRQAGVNVSSRIFWAP